MNGKKRIDLEGWPCMNCPYRAELISKVRGTGKMIDIPFRDDFKEAMLSGKKTCTTRSKKYGKPGDIFRKFGATFLIQDVTQANLAFVAKFLYKLEGLSSSDEFKRVWKELHPRNGFEPKAVKYAHFFARVG